jgi:predicted DNA-binding transcriptional regulator YafY
MRQFLDQLPRVIATKPDPTRRRDGPRQQQVVARALEATLRRRQAAIVYHSQSSDRTKSYLVHPYRLAHAQGGLYLLAYVPAYRQVRTFAVERIQDVSLLDERFTPIETLTDEAFPHSLGVHSGPPEQVMLEFRPGAADYVRARQWHHSQQLSELPTGGITVTLDVCLDRALRSWILSFGPSVRVVAPRSLAREIAEQIEKARAQYSQG